MSPRTRYWIIHWVRVLLWPLPVMTIVKCGTAALKYAPALLGRLRSAYANHQPARRIAANIAKLPELMPNPVISSVELIAQSAAHDVVAPRDADGSADQ